MKLGVAGFFPGDWRQINLDVTQRVRAAGFRGAQWFFNKPLEADPDEVRRVKAAFDGAGLEICQVNGWYEALVDPDDAIRRVGVHGLMALTRLGAEVGAPDGFTPSVYVRPGGLNPKGHWWPHRDNHSPETFDRLVDSLRQVCRVAEPEGVILAVEGHVLSPLDSARKIAQLLDAVASPALKFNVDPVNFIGTVADVHDTRRVLNDLFDTLGAQTVVAHAKDVALGNALVLHIEEVLLGSGSLDYPLFLHRFEQICPDGYILIEHLPDEKILLARTSLIDFAKRAGVSIEC